MTDNTKAHRNNIQNNFYGPVGQYIEHVEHNHLGMSAEGGFKIDNDGSSETMQSLFPDVPTSEAMCHAVVKMVQEGLWYGNQAWAVVYRVYQIKGYMGGMSDFVREVKRWPQQLATGCNYDAVQKPVAKGTMIGMPERWESQGATPESVALAQALLMELDRKGK